MTTGLILGKFLPPHRGHEYLVNFAAGFADAITVHVCATPAEPIPGALRYEWMRETFAGRPNLTVVYNPLPQTPQDDPLNFWRLWRDSLLSRQPNNQPPDFVFASEPYGFELARTLGAQYIPVDPPRSRFPVSGTAVRADPLREWEYLLPATRPYFARRVAVVGAESSGKSTLTAALAAHFGTTFAPEYARTYLEALPPDELARLYAPGGFDAEAMRHFVRGQAASVEAMARQCNRVVFSDTKAVVTALWCRHFLGDVPAFVSEQARAQHFDLYLLTAATQEWAREEQRVQPDFSDRLRFEEECGAMLEEHGCPFVRLSGTWAEREEQAVAAVKVLLGENRFNPALHPV